MQPRIDWPGICNDWAESGFSKHRYFMTTRFERFVRYGVLPGYSDIIRHLHDFEKSRTPGVEKVTASDTETASVHHLSARDVRAALSGADIHCDDEINNHVTVILANGTTIEFEAENAERFVLRAITAGRTV